MLTVEDAEILTHDGGHFAACVRLLGADLFWRQTGNGSERTSRTSQMLFHRHR